MVLLKTNVGMVICSTPAVLQCGAIDALKCIVRSLTNTLAHIARRAGGLCKV